MSEAVFHLMVTKVIIMLILRLFNASIKWWCVNQMVVALLEPRELLHMKRKKRGPLVSIIAMSFIWAGNESKRGDLSVTLMMMVLMRLLLFMFFIDYSVLSPTHSMHVDAIRLYKIHTSYHHRRITI